MTESSALDGITVLRFAHAFESGGGTERYLDDLDCALLRRNAMTIVRLHLTRNTTGKGPIEDRIGRGALLRVPLQVSPARGADIDSNGPTVGLRLKQMARDWVLYNPIVWRTAGNRWTNSFKLRNQPGQAVGAGSAAAEVMRNRGVDLAMLHFFGGADADEVICSARAARVPFAVLNHYSNDRFLHVAVRKHAMLADGIAGVNGLDVPPYLRKRFVTLSDGVDTELFRAENAQPLPGSLSYPLILLPARVVREKGPVDLVRAMAEVRRAGVDCGVAFAGRADSAEFVEELRREIGRAGLGERTHFLGNLAVEELRDWFAASAVVVLPTYHHEGLPRVIIEAQAMGKPVIAYATGGVPEGISSGKTGFLLRTGDVGGLAQRLRELLSSPLLCASIGVSARKTVEDRFSLAALAERHERFYKKVIEGFKAKDGKTSLS